MTSFQIIANDFEAFHKKKDFCKNSSSDGMGGSPSPRLKEYAIAEKQSNRIESRKQTFF